MRFLLQHGDLILLDIAWLEPPEQRVVVVERQTEAATVELGSDHSFGFEGSEDE